MPMREIAAKIEETRLSEVMDIFKEFTEKRESMDGGEMIQSIEAKTKELMEELQYWEKKEEAFKPYFGI